MKLAKGKDASGRFFVGIEPFPSILYWWEKRKIIKNFSLAKKSIEVNTVSESFQQFQCDRGLVGIDWDNWSGFTVTSLNSDSDSLVIEIGEYLKKNHKLKG